MVLGCSYALVGLWLDTLLMGATFGLVVAFMVGHSQGKIGLIAYRQSILIISFAVLSPSPFCWGATTTVP